MSRFSVGLELQGEAVFEELVLYDEDDLPDIANFTIVEGVIEARSALPNPKDSSYPDCQFVCKFVGNSIIAGEPCPREIALVVDGFADYTTLLTNALKDGDKVCCLIVPFEQLDESKKEIQQSDTLDLFNLESYYAVGLCRIYSFQALYQFSLSGIDFAQGDGEYVSIFQRSVNDYSVSDEMLELQRAVIERDLIGINAMLSAYPATEREILKNDFKEKWEAEKSRDTPGRNRIEGQVWRNVDGTFWALSENYKLYVDRPEVPKDKLDALAALRDFLLVNGCQLIVVPVPENYDIAARVINEEFRKVPDFRSAGVVQALLENGIEAIYSGDLIVENFGRNPFSYMFPDPHPADAVQDILTDVVAKRLSRYGIAETLDHNLFSESTVLTATYGDPSRFYFKENCDIGSNHPGDRYTCRRVLYDGKVIENDPDSPVLVLGNSFINSPLGRDGGSFRLFLTEKTNYPVVSVASSGAAVMTTLVKRFFSDPAGLLQNKRVVVLVLSCGYFDSRSTFNNIREMDRQALLLAGKKTCARLPVRGMWKKFRLITPVCGTPMRSESDRTARSRC